MDVMPDFYLGQMDKAEIKKMEQLISKITLAATHHGRGKNLLSYIYIAGLYHGSSLYADKAST